MISPPGNPGARARTMVALVSTLALMFIVGAILVVMLLSEWEVQQRLKLEVEESLERLGAGTAILAQAANGVLSALPDSGSTPLGEAQQACRLAARECQEIHDQKSPQLLPAATSLRNCTEALIEATRKLPRLAESRQVGTALDKLRAEQLVIDELIRGSERGIAEWNRRVALNWKSWLVAFLAGNSFYSPEGRGGSQMLPGTRQVSPPVSPSTLPEG